jgi:2-oxoglutarate ferredoxin oxidoreductase subunit alpha
MVKQLSWKVGGQQGEGIESTGEIFAIALNRLGYYLYGYRHFSSRIKGGHTNNKIRVSTENIQAISDDLDILVAFDQETIDFNFHELSDCGFVLADTKFNPSIPTDSSVTLLAVPFTDLATDVGALVMKNMVAVGASSALLGLDNSIFKEVITEIFGRKGQNIIDKNMQAIQAGYDFVEGKLKDVSNIKRLDPADGNNRMFMIGNDAIALGAVAAGCKFMAAYPITPASEIMEYLIKKLPQFGGTVIQTEDEIAACTMAIGANYAGVRTITASAGPGLSLMMEAIGLAGITETPVVIVNTQRGGPSTGLPTKQEQSDLMAMIYGTHGEIPKVVIAPSNSEEAFYDTVEAFNISEIYQCPVILLTDLQLSLGKQTVEKLDYNKISINRGKIIDEVTEANLSKGGYFKRYEVTPDGVSPRVFPGTKDGLHHVTGVEHDETGKPSENPTNRDEQMDKRLRKLDGLRITNAVIKDEPYQDADVLLVGFNSTYGVIKEARERLEADGIKVNQAHIRQVHPFPSDEVDTMINCANKVLVIENNATGQLANIIKMNTGQNRKITSVLKYDGNPFIPKEIYNRCKGLL